MDANCLDPDPQNLMNPDPGKGNKKKNDFKTS